MEGEKMPFDSYRDRGLTGLTNLGNTCFINSCIQILSHTYELSDFLNDGSYRRKLQKRYDTTLLVEWDSLRQLMWSENCIVSPGKFITTIQKLAQIKGLDLFTGHSQNDLPEFLLFVVDCFHTSLSREVTMSITGEVANPTDQIALQCFEMIKRMYAKEYSEIWNMFYGVHISQIISLDDDKKVLSSSPEPYFMINLSIPKNNKSPTLLDCFDLYVEGETLRDDNAWFNESTGHKQDVKKKMTYWSFPTVLVIDLKRINAVNHNNKNQILVDFPIRDLDLSKYVMGYHKGTYVYDLYGICNHTGGTQGGHYTSFVKNANGKWYHFNDTCVTEVANETDIVTPMAYCFFYRKKTLQ
jgi:ubiquitin C-terminal hydrolase